MSIQKKWSIDEVKSKIDDGLIVEVQWRVSSVNTKPYSIHGTCNFEKGETFIPFEEINESQVIEWVKNQLGENVVTELEKNIDDTLQLTSYNNRKPWDTI